MIFYFKTKSLNKN